jgi:uncharacterized membrane protein YphA (DoxX/SURF4 family)
METTTPVISKSALWTGRVLSVLPCLMLLFSGVMKFNRTPSLEEGFAHLQIDIGLAFGLGVLEIACTVIYLIPRTAVLGAILLTGYLGGAMLTHLRVGDPWIVQSLLGVALWGGLWLRDPRLRALIPLVKA